MTELVVPNRTKNCRPIKCVVYVFVALRFVFKYFDCALFSLTLEWLQFSVDSHTADLHLGCRVENFETKSIAFGGFSATVIYLHCSFIAVVCLILPRKWCTIIVMMRCWQWADKKECATVVRSSSNGPVAMQSTELHHRSAEEKRTISTRYMFHLLNHIHKQSHEHIYSWVFSLAFSLACIPWIYVVSLGWCAILSIVITFQFDSVARLPRYIIDDKITVPTYSMWNWIFYWFCWRIWDFEADKSQRPKWLQCPFTPSMFTCA